MPALMRRNNDLLGRFRSTPVHAVIVQAIDDTLQDAVTIAEMKWRGASVA